MKSEHQNNTITLLGLESSGSACSVGISHDNRLLAEISVNLKNIHSEKMASFVEYLLQNCQLTAKELTAIILSAGPGSFTGLRIGYSLAKGYAHALGIPIVEVSTLDIWAYQIGYQSQPVVPIIDAHRGDVFCAVYEWREEELQKVTEDTLIAIENLAEVIPSHALILGADARKLRSQLEPVLPDGGLFYNPSPTSPQIWSLLELGLQKFQQGLVSDIKECEPFYMRAFKGVS